MPLTATTDRDPFALADASEDACIDRRTAHWVRDVRSVAAQRAQDADRVECAGCGTSAPFAASRPCGTARACESCAAHLCASCGRGLAEQLVGYTDVCNDCERPAAVPCSGDEGLRPGAAALLGLCNECGEDADDCDCDDEDDDAAELAADRILERQELSDLDDCDGFADAGDWS